MNTKFDRADQSSLKKRAIFTIVSANYIGFASTLMQSVREHHPEVDRYIILSDAMHEFADIDLAANLMSCDQIDIANIDNMKLWYTVIEFNTAIKPYSFLYLFEKLNYEDVCYIDPDIQLFQPIREVFWGLSDHSCVLTPHMMDPLQDGKEPSDLTIMKSGVYNLGFLGLKNDNDGRRLARWWADRCYDGCRVDIAGNRFTDQRWMDLAPVFISRPYILRHPGYNVAYWNLAHRTVSYADNAGWQVDGEPLVFFHFSGIKPDDDKVFSKHTNRFDSNNLGIVAELCRQYRERVLRNKWKEYNKTPYAFGAFPNGRPIDDTMRHWVARVVDEKLVDKSIPFATHSDFFDEIDEFALEKGAFLTRYMHQFWLDRTDLRNAFNIFDAQGLPKFYEWFLNDEDVRKRVDGRTLSAAATLRAGSARDSKKAAAVRETPPWPPVSERAWNGKSKDVLEFFSSDVVVKSPQGLLRLPVMAALLWETRADLHQYFPLKSAESVRAYIVWFLTDGAEQSSLDLAMLTPEFVGEFASISDLTRYYGDVPLTDGLLMTRKIVAGRSLPGWEKVPVEKASRTSHGIWFAMIAPHLFHWPESLVKPVLDYFRRRTNISFDRFRLNRAVLGIWELRSDIQWTFPLTSRDSIAGYIHWLIMFGLPALNIPIEAFDPDLPRFLKARSKKYPKIARILELVYDHRPDIRNHFDVSAQAGRQAFVDWAATQLLAETGGALKWCFDSKPGISEPVTEAIERVQVLLTGEWQASSGRGEDVRCTARSLLAVGFDNFLVFDVDTGDVFNATGARIDGDPRIEADVNIVHMNADMALDTWRMLTGRQIASKKSIGYWAWELDSLPSYWRHAYSFYDEIWASTRFAEGAFLKEGLRPVKLVPMAVLPPEREEVVSRRELGLADDETVFLFMFDFRSYVSRKNPEAVIDAFGLAFPDPEQKVRLVIKTQGGAAAGDAWRKLNAHIRDPRIELRDVKMPRDALFSLIATADAFVSLHRSEGFGRGPAEAMLLGVPTIVTDYSGTVDFATSDCALPVKYRMAPVAEDEYPGVQGQSWADADIESAVEQMRWVYENPKGASALGERGRSAIIELYAPQHIGAIIISTLGLNAYDAKDRRSLVERPTQTGTTNNDLNVLQQLTLSELL